MSSSMIDRSRSGTDPGLERRFSPRLLCRFAVSARGLGAAFSLSLTAAIAVVVLSAAPAAAAPALNGIPGYATELVSPSSTAGQEPNVKAVGGDGTDVLFTSSGGIADVDNLGPLGTTYRARRTESGWVTATLGSPSPLEYPSYNPQVDWQPDWWRHDRPLTMWGVGPKSAPGLHQVFVSGRKGGPWDQTTPLMSVDAQIWATAEDLSGVLIAARSDVRPALTDGTTDTRTVNSLTAIRRDAAGVIEVRQVARDDAGVSLHPQCNLFLGGGSGGVTRGAVDRDGLSRVVFTTGGSGACNSATRRRVYAAEPFSNSPAAVDVSASRCTLGSPDCGNAASVQFVGGAIDASRLYMITTQRLLDEDVHAGADLYEYDYRRPDEERLQLVSKGPEAPLVQGAVAVSDDGSHVYFVANGALDHDESDTRQPQTGSPNLYVRIQGEVGSPAKTRFVATLAPGDSSLWSNPNLAEQRLTPDGRFLVFASAAQLTLDDEDTYRDVYRYDAMTGELHRAWPNDPEVNGSGRTAAATIGRQIRTGAAANGGRNARPALSTVADDGSAIAFTTSQALAEGDVNDADDAFVWVAETDRVSMISDGQDARGVQSNGMSADGSTHLFSTTSRISWQHTATSVGLYAHRLGGGFDEPPAPPAPCVGDSCQGSSSSAPVLPGIGSVAFGGDGNVAAPDRVRGSVRVSKLKAITGSAARLRVRVPDAGRISLVGPGIRNAKKSAAKAGAYQLRVVLKPRARKQLRKRSRLTVRARVVFQPKSGKAMSKAVRVTFKQPKAKRANTNRKGGR